jgi:DNA-binding transcriptional ArsR family regulator
MCARLTYQLLVDYNSEERGCFPKRELLAANLGVSKPTVDRALTELCDRKLITKKRQGRGHPNRYFFPDESSPETTQEVHESSPVSTHMEESSPMTTLESSPVSTPESSPMTTPIRTGTKEQEPKEKNRGRRTTIPENFTVTDEMRETAIRYGVHPTQIDDQTERFINYWVSEGKTKLDWVATWRGWMQRSIGYDQTHLPRKSASSNGDTRRFIV